MATNIAKTSTFDPEAPVTEEFMLDSDASLESIDDAQTLDAFEEVFSYDSKHVYRFTHDQSECACKLVEELDCPINDVSARGGALHVTFHTPDVEALKRVLVDLRSHWSGVAVKRLLHSGTEGSDDDLVLVDRSELTARQREVLQTAHEMGYFEHGQGANAGEVATALDINTSTFSEHLRAAQRKLMDTVLDQ